MKINEHILSLPPHLSTSWKEVKALRSENQSLIVTLMSGQVVNVPDLDRAWIDSAFQAHAAYLERKQPETLFNPMEKLFSKSMDGSIRFAIASPFLDGTLQNLEHNPQESNGPDLPPELLERVRDMSKMFAGQIVELAQKSEPHCNCPWCQITRALEATTKRIPKAQELGSIEEPVKDEDLRFESWDIKELGEKHYSVTNKLDKNESYQVFLGDPVGCTCGKRGCEHIIRTLHS